jgi:hypothetical protein
VDVDLPRPRHMEDPGLIDIARELIGDLRDEVPARRGLSEQQGA